MMGFSHHVDDRVHPDLLIEAESRIRDLEEQRDEQVAGALETLARLMECDRQINESFNGLSRALHATVERLQEIAG